MFVILGILQQRENLPRTALSFSSGNTINTNLTNLTNRFEEHRGYGQNPDPDPHTQYMRRGFGARAGGAVWPIGYRLVYGDPVSSPAYALSYQTPRIAQRSELCNIWSGDPASEDRREECFR